uniref:SET and MYND domain containing 4 n=1 Tax=Latimeria chalumnae TaxID=7897 RepID=H3AH97_LATCH
MEFPVQDWRVHIAQKWAALCGPEKEKFALVTGLEEIFNSCCSQLSLEDETFLTGLTDCLSVRKEPQAMRFYREKGNENFKLKKYIEAAVLYSKGISNASPTSDEVSLCFANRSAALLYLHQYEECLQDIKRAQKHGYPESLEHKVLLRRVECLLQLGKFQEANEAFKEVEKKITSNRNLSSTTAQTSLQRLKDLKSSKSRMKMACLETPAERLKGLRLQQESERVSCASASINMQFDLSHGRHLVALKDIEPGETLVEEEAFVSVLIPGEQKAEKLEGPEAVWDSSIGNQDLHCHHCLKASLSGLTCPSCCFTRYCSESCKERAQDAYHRIECPLGALLLALGVYCHVAFRTALVAGFEEIQKVKEKKQIWDEFQGKQTLQNEAINSSSGVEEGIGFITQHGKENTEEQSAPIPGCDESGKYQSSYLSVASLLAHTEHHSPEHRYLCGLTVVSLFKKIQELKLEPTIVGQRSQGSQSGNRPEGNGDDVLSCELSPELRIMGTVVLKHILQLHCNAQAITGIRERGKTYPPQ